MSSKKSLLAVTVPDLAAAAVRHLAAPHCLALTGCLLLFHPAAVAAPPAVKFRLAEAQPAAGLTETMLQGEDETLFLHEGSLLSGDDLTDARLVEDEDGKPAIEFEFSDAATAKLGELARRQRGKRLAVVVDGNVIGAFTIARPAAAETRLHGDFGVPEGREIVRKLERHGVSDVAPAASEFVDLFNGRDLSGWVDVNTSPETWRVRDGLLVCRGEPIGVMRSEKQYENFVLHIEWRHMKPGGNSGVFVWSEGFVPEGRSLPKGMEVQMLELDWVNQHRKSNGEPADLGYISGELFGAGGLTATPVNPRGRRSKSTELRCNGAGRWNVYDVVCVDGTVHLSINGKFVNSIRDSSVRKGYLCLESEGSEIHFRNIRILELPPGNAAPEQTAKLIE